MGQPLPSRGERRLRRAGALGWVSPPPTGRTVLSEDPGDNAADALKPDKYSINVSGSALALLKTIPQGSVDLIQIRVECSSSSSSFL